MREREIVVDHFGEITLLPDASVDEGNLVFGEFGNRVSGEIGNDGVGMLARVANYVGHRSLFPSRV